MSYVFNYMQDSGYLLRVPTPIAALICHAADMWFGRTWDYAPTPDGLR